MLLINIDMMGTNLRSWATTNTIAHQQQQNKEQQQKHNHDNNYLQNKENQSINNQYIQEQDRNYKQQHKKAPIQSKQQLSQQQLSEFAKRGSVLSAHNNDDKLIIKGTDLIGQTIGKQNVKQDTVQIGTSSVNSTQSSSSSYVYSQLNSLFSEYPILSYLSIILLIIIAVLCMIKGRLLKRNININLFHNNYKGRRARYHNHKSKTQTNNKKNKSSTKITNKVNKLIHDGKHSTSMNNPIVKDIVSFYIGNQYNRQQQINYTSDNGNLKELQSEQLIEIDMGEEASGIAHDQLISIQIDSEYKQEQEQEQEQEYRQYADQQQQIRNKQKQIQMIEQCIRPQQQNTSTYDIETNTDMGQQKQ